MVTSKRLLSVPAICIIVVGTCLYITSWEFDKFEDYKPIGVYRCSNLPKDSTDSSNLDRPISKPCVNNSKHEYIDNCTDWIYQDYFESTTVQCYEANQNREGILQIEKDDNELFFVSYINQSLQYGTDICVRLESYFLNGTVKSSNGGDLFFAISNSINVDKENFSTAGKVVDHLNGSYSFYFAGAWSGRANISILRVHSSEAVEWIRERMWKEEKRLFWKGIYKCNQNHQEETLCYVEQNANIEESSNLCLYRNMEALGNTTLTCGRPQICTCQNLASYRGAVQDILKKADSLLENRRNLFKGINLEFYIIKNYEIYLEDSGMEEEAEDDFYPADIRRSDGFWVNNSWHSFPCAGYHFKDVKKELSTCLQHTNISLLGDSTIRQWFHELVHIFDGEQHSDELKMFHRVKHLDIDITFQFHPLCILQEQRIIPFASMKYESEVIREMRDCNRVVVVGPWAHYGQWTKKSYLDRLYGIRNSVVDFLERCPNATVAVKGSHPRNHKNLYFYIYGNDYIFLQYNRILREVFDGTGVVFLDVWDMNLSYYASNTLHMPQAVIREEMNLLFACHVCR